MKMTEGCCMKPFAYYEYCEFNNASFFTMVLMPAKTGKYPVIITRSPYVSNTRDTDEDELVRQFESENGVWAENNYVLIFQHCRGQGKSSGDFVPYIYEREDGIALREWVRRQSFYDGRILLLGGSYTASLHYSTAPFEDDIKGAVFNVQDSERYRLWYRNGSMRRGHANWHFNLYKAKSDLNKTHTIESFSSFPLQKLSQRVLGEFADDFEQMLSAPRTDDAFWDTRYGGCEARDALTDADIPILMTTGYNDFYVGGMFDMWRKMGEETKRKSAMIVSAYNHGDSPDAIRFPCASVREKFGNDYAVKWFDHIIKNEEPFVKPGKITYYRIFENKWKTDYDYPRTEEITLSPWLGEKTFVYNPANPPGFEPEGCWMNQRGETDGVVSLYTLPLERDVLVRGRIRASFTVSSDCEDTSFYIMIGVCTPDGDYSLRHDITSLLYQHRTYVPNTKVSLDFAFDDYAFQLKKGQILRIDISSVDKNTYVCHSNKKGDYSLAEDFKTAHNTVYTDESYLVLPAEIIS